MTQQRALSLLTAMEYFLLQTRKAADWLAKSMVEQGNAVALLSGELDTSQRIAVIQRFRDGKEKVLITTNVASRGKSQDLGKSHPHDQIHQVLSEADLDSFTFCRLYFYITIY